tara:strand:+ start:138 stop:278 length:141 start_codon:yes stop_codon:yes gene_type:complete
VKNTNANITDKNTIVKNAEAVISANIIYENQDVKIVEELEFANTTE